MLKKFFGGGDKKPTQAMEIFDPGTEHSKELLEHHTDVDFIRKFLKLLITGLRRHFQYLKLVLWKDPLELIPHIG